MYLGLNSKKDAPSPGQDLEDMQSLHYLMEEGDAQYRARQFGLALKKYDAIRKVRLMSLHACTIANSLGHQIFDETEDDQYDFHGYSIRKFTINIYFRYTFFIFYADKNWIYVLVIAL